MSENRSTPKRIALIPGSFDPITIGHYDIALRAAELFDKVVIAVMQNCDKRYMFPIETRFEAARAAFVNDSRFETVLSEGLLAQLAVDISKKNDGASVFLVKGLRNSQDFTYEYEMYEINRALRDIETVFIPSKKEHMFISSTFVREMIKYGEDFSPFIPRDSYTFLKKN